MLHGGGSTGDAGRPPRRTGISICAVRRAMAAVAGLAFTAACQPPPGGIRIREGDPRWPWRHELLCRSVEGRPIDVYSLGQGPSEVLFMATIHGDESAGTPLLRRFMEELAARPGLAAGRRVMVIPVANPDGFFHRQRHNARGIDLNRNFPAANWNTAGPHGPVALSEPESAALYHLLFARRPARVISIHQPLACLDHDGPGAEPIARVMAGECHLQVRKLGGRPGSLGSWVGETLGIPVITVEFGAAESAWDDAALWARYGRMLLAALAFPEPPPPA
jgi:protein MpaA